MEQEKQKVLGVVGGLGPIATAHFMELVVTMTDAPSDQENLEMIIYNFPSIPDRTGYILGSNLKSPLPGLLNVSHALSRQEVACIAIPCVTAHYFYRELSAAVPTPILNAVEETAQLLKDSGIRRAGIMGTDGTVLSGLYSDALERRGIRPVVPSRPRQQDVMHLIYRNVKAGLEPEMDRFDAVHRELEEKGAEAVILGCTELSMIKRDYCLGAGFLDTMEVLAKRAILGCGKQVRKKYDRLIT